MRKILDVRGLACPKPVLEVKKAIEMKESDEFEVITNSTESKENILRFLDSNSIKAVVDEKSGEIHIMFKLSRDFKSVINEDLSYTCSSSKGFKGIIITKNRLGEGEEKLGQILIRSFFQALVEMTPVPERLFFVNSGVFLTIKDSPIIDELKKLVEAGTKIYSCGTCLDYYKIKEQLIVGEVGNMYLLLEILSSGGVFV